MFSCVNRSASDKAPGAAGAAIWLAGFAADAFGSAGTGPAFADGTGTAFAAAGLALTRGLAAAASRLGLMLAPHTGTVMEGFLAVSASSSSATPPPHA